MGLLIRLRYLAAVVVVIFAVHAVGLLVLGTMRAYQAYGLLAQGPGWQGSDRPGIHIAESVDALLFALVLIVLALGTANLFLTSAQEGSDLPIPAWIRVRNLTELKLLLWEGILLALLVASLTRFIANLEHLSWVDLVMPVAILILSLSLFLLKRGTDENAREDGNR